MHIARPQLHSCSAVKIVQFSAYPVVRMIRQTLFSEDVDKLVSFVHRGHLQDPLLNVNVGSTDPADGHKDIVIQHITGKFLYFFWERGTEHQSLTLILRRHSHLVHQPFNIWKESHVEHPVSFVKDQILHLRKTNL